MCGIVGEVTYQSNTIHEGWIKHACDLMRHRGPDGVEYLCQARFAFGHRRLSIIDIDGGTQPMSYAANRYWITYNGEIYNYRELRQELGRSGCSFKTKSDTEVILAVYATWGIDGIKRLNGIFAFGLWDNEEETLILARDHLGVKPLLYHHDEHGLRFSSEMKGLLAHPRVEVSIDQQSLSDYFALGYVLTPNTIINGVYKLPPGYILRLKNEAISLHQYWNLADYVPRPGENAISDNPVDTFDALLEQTVREQMVSDVPVGTFLSGGIDSSSITYFATKQHQQIQTFSAGFEEESYSELDYAQLAADHLQTVHTDLLVPPVSFDTLRELVWLYDEPLGDTSIIPTYFVSKLAREHVKVVLSGDGGDELLAGYDTYLANRFQPIYTRVPKWAHQGILQASHLISDNFRKISAGFKVKRFVSNAYAPPEIAHFGWRNMFNAAQINDLTGRADWYDHTRDVYNQHFDAVSDASWLSRFLYVDMKTWLVDDILAKVDRASMANGLEARVPFLGPRFVEQVMHLPDRLKFRGLQRKAILKQIMHQRLPRKIIYRQKRGFNSPVGIWMQKQWKPAINQIFAEKKSTLVDLTHPLLTNLWDEHGSGRVDHTYTLWALLSLLLWEDTVLRSIEIRPITN